MLVVVGVLLAARGKVKGERLENIFRPGYLLSPVGIIWTTIEDTQLMDLEFFGLGLVYI